ncbi:hypothetical protein TNCV_691061 [Trichonephila clavipes]|nr:hypothetical protein TNCV_691061 [Trichonephila clavipes]
MPVKTVEAQSTPISVVWKFGEEYQPTLTGAVLYLGSELRIPLIIPLMLIQCAEEIKPNQEISRLRDNLAYFPLKLIIESFTKNRILD